MRWLTVFIFISFLLASKVFASTPDHLMWVAKDQDALILGEVLTSNASEVSEVKVLVAFPQTKVGSLYAGDTFSLQQKSLAYDDLKVGHKYLMSISKQGGFFQKLFSNTFQVKWGVFELTPNSSNLDNARLLNPALVDIQYMISTGGKQPLPSYNYSSD